MCSTSSKPVMNAETARILDSRFCLVHVSGYIFLKQSRLHRLLGKCLEVRFCSILIMYSSAGSAQEHRNRHDLAKGTEANEARACEFSEIFDMHPGSILVVKHK